MNKNFKEDFLSLFVCIFIISGLYFPFVLKLGFKRVFEMFGFSLILYLFAFIIFFIAVSSEWRKKDE